MWARPIYLTREKESQFVLLFPKLLKDPEKFLNFTRMSVESFKELLACVEPDITHAHTNMRNPISPTERLLITLR